MVIGLLLILLSISPIILIWCINNLFGLNIAYTLYNWFLMFLILIILRGKIYLKKIKL